MARYNPKHEQNHETRSQKFKSPRSRTRRFKFLRTNTFFLIIHYHFWVFRGTSTCSPKVIQKIAFATFCFGFRRGSPRVIQKIAFATFFFLVSPRQSQSHPNESLWYAFSGSSIKSIMPLKAVWHLYSALEPSCICIYICVHRPLI